MCVCGVCVVCVCVCGVCVWFLDSFFICIFFVRQNMTVICVCVVYVSVSMYNLIAILTQYLSNGSQLTFECHD